MNCSTKKSPAYEWIEFVCVMVATAVATTFVFVSVSNAQPKGNDLPNLNSSYSCEGDETACEWSGQKFTVIQSGANLEVRNEKGGYGHVKLTSPISLSAGPIWNMLGVIASPDNRTIQWSNGTTWTKMERS